ncbi:MAG TPA: hypothetical protein EYH31_11725 [Anaerolineae bacterium]|nr:hypothetical protein [Anaerolineae bacterium]
MRNELHPPQSFSWRPIGPVRPGGNVFTLTASLADSRSLVWAGTSAGVFRSQDGGQQWEQSVIGLSTPLIGALAVASDGTTLFAGGLNGTLARSEDSGRTWTTLTQTPDSVQVSRIAISPTYDKDRTVLVATDGAGILRSGDAGQNWNLSNEGLTDRSVLDMVWAWEQSSSRVVFALSQSSVYRSDDAGRHWRQVGSAPNGVTLQVLAVGPLSTAELTLFAGSESSGVFCSTDGGANWKPISTGIGEVGINCLWLSPHFATDRTILAGASSGQIFRSGNAGEQWDQVYAGDVSVLALAGDGQTVLAGMLGGGVLRSQDSGHSWEPANEGLAAHSFTHLVTEATGALLAFGEDVGIWRSSTDNSWTPLAGLDPLLPLGALALHGDVLLLASHTGGVFRSNDRGCSWETTDDATDVQSLLLASDHNGRVLAWAGCSDGSLLFSTDGGRTWERVSRLFRAPVLALFASPHFADDRTLFAGSGPTQGHDGRIRISIWRSEDAGHHWQRVAFQPTTAVWLDAVMLQAPGRQPYDQAVFVTGPYCLRPLGRSKNVWVAGVVSPEGVNVLGIAQHPQSGRLYAATAAGMYHSDDQGRTWMLTDPAVAERSFVDVVAAPAGVYALGLGGMIWKQ